eukprot:2324554-Rhodomonas_salina.1
MAYDSWLMHGYFVAKYHEIGMCGSIIAGNIPFSGQGSGLEEAMVHLSEEMSEDEIIAALQTTLENTAALERMARHGRQYFEDCTFANGVRYWSRTLVDALQSWRDSESAVASGRAVAVSTKHGGSVFVHAPTAIVDELSSQLLRDSGRHRRVDVLVGLFDSDVRSMSPNAKLVVDVGARLGLFSMLAASAGFE